MTRNRNHENCIAPICPARFVSGRRFSLPHKLYLVRRARAFYSKTDLIQYILSYLLDTPDSILNPSRPRAILICPRNRVEEQERCHLIFGHVLRELHYWACEWKVMIGLE